MKLEQLKVIAHGIATQFGASCEVLIHDVQIETLESSIVYIEHGDISNRNVGDGASHAVLDAIRNDDGQCQGKQAYLTRTKDGRVLRSTTMYIRDDNDKLQYLLCINYDITDFITLQNSLDRIITSSNRAWETKGERIVTSVSDLLSDMLSQAEKVVERPAHLMNKNERLEAIRYLYCQGAFLISKASDKISEYFNVSKFTLYNDLNQVKEEEELHGTDSMGEK